MAPLIPERPGRGPVSLWPGEWLSVPGYCLELEPEPVSEWNTTLIKVISVVVRTSRCNGQWKKPQTRCDDLIIIFFKLWIYDTYLQRRKSASSNVCLCVLYFNFVIVQCSKNVQVLAKFNSIFYFLTNEIFWRLNSKIKFLKLL